MALIPLIHACGGYPLIHACGGYHFPLLYTIYVFIIENRSVVVADSLSEFSHVLFKLIIFKYDRFVRCGISICHGIRDLHLSRTLYLLSPRLRVFIVLKRDLFVYRDDSLTS